MRPLRLEMEAFGPYAESTSVDFEALPDDRPFVIGGPTGAGKSSIFDAMTYALFGTLPGHRSDHHRLRSDHAAPEQMCRVEFEFADGADRWRITRTPKQVRARRDGTGTTEPHATAHLERFHGGVWEPVETKIGDINARVGGIVGLSSEQFQRVVLLPQGDFERVLNAGTTERHDLLRTLFGTDPYRHVAERLAGERDGLRAALAKVSTKVETLRSAASAECARLGELLGESPVEDDSLGSCCSHPPRGGDAVVIDIRDGASRGVDGADRVDADGSVPSASAIREHLEELTGGPLARRERAADSAASVARSAREGSVLAQQQAVDVAERERLTAEMARLAAGAEEHSEEVERLVRARRAESAMGSVAARDRAHVRASSARDAAGTAWKVAWEAADGLDVHDPAVGVAPADPGEGDGVDLLDRVSDSLVRFESLATAAAEAKEHRDAEAALRDEGAALDEQLEELRVRAEQSRSDLDRLRHERNAAAALAAGVDGAERTARDARSRVQQRIEFGRLSEALTSTEARISQLDVRRKQAEDRSAGLEQRRLDLAVAAEGEESDDSVTSARAALEAHRRLDELRGTLDGATRRADAAAAAEADLFARFVAGAAPRLAADLRDGEPCSVCGSRDHPVPAATPEADVVEHAEVETARVRAAAARTELQDCRDEVAALLATHPGAGAGSSRELEAELDACIHAREAAQRATVELSELDRELSTSADDIAATERRRSEASTTRDETRGHRDRLAGALAGAATSPVEELEAEATAAEALSVDARNAKDHLAEFDERIDAVQALLESVRNSSESAGRRLEVIRADLGRHDDEATLLAARVSAAVGTADPAGLASRAGEACDLARRASDLLRRSAERHRQRAEAETDVRAAVAAAGFADDSDVRAAALDPQDLAQREEAAAARRERESHVRERLRELATKELPAEAPDLSAAQAAADAAEEASRSANEVVTTAKSHLRSVLDHLGEAEAADREHAADREELDQLTTIVDILDGRATMSRTSLEDWVLAAYLRDVVDAANVHLRAMTHGRYELDVDSSHVQGNRRSGLDLVVIDAHTGRARPTASLSGGETFQGSLAMALGLADVLTANRAGVRVDALFVDEGFGSLDGDAVEGAIDLLDALRDRGAMVGIITHVEQVKEALPVAIEVRHRADRRGSELCQRSCV